MRFEERHDLFRRLFDDRSVLRRAADDRHAADLAVAKHLRRFQDRIAALTAQTVEGEPFAHLFLVALAIPAIMEHRLGAPLVRHVLEQIGEESLAGIVGHDGALGVQTLQGEDHRGGIVVPGAVRKLDDRNDRRLHMGEDGAVRHVDLLPDVRKPPIAHHGAHLHRIGRAEPAMDRVDAHDAATVHRSAERSSAASR